MMTDYNGQKVGLVQNTLGPNVFGGLFEDRIDPFATAYIDNMIMTADNHNVKNKVAILVEPASIFPHTYNWVYENQDIFQMILTHNKTLSEQGEKFCYYPVWPRIWIPSERRKIYEKEKMVSAIFSNRRRTQGHKIRHEIVKLLGDKFEAFGKGYNEVACKSEATADYRYQIVVENEWSGYASEKINDCFCCGTVPIYWGDAGSNVHDYYDKDGYIIFNDLQELSNILDNKISEKDYQERLPAIVRNFEKARNLSLDQMYWNHGIKNLFKK
tara:strand:+ start:1409 stop:2221 length:813 start_codon:yes stop_codon:yes gene_type:complete